MSRQIPHLQTILLSDSMKNYLVNFVDIYRWPKKSVKRHGTSWPCKYSRQEIQIVKGVFIASTILYLWTLYLSHLEMNSWKFFSSHTTNDLSFIGISYVGAHVDDFSFIVISSTDTLLGLYWCFFVSTNKSFMHG